MSKKRSKVRKTKKKVKLINDPRIKRILDAKYHKDMQLRFSQKNGYETVENKVRGIHEKKED